MEGPNLGAAEAEPEGDGDGEGVVLEVGVPAVVGVAEDDDVGEPVTCASA
ncbi:hypothetical protein LL946_15220 [Knoellia locipacati]